MKIIEEDDLVLNIDEWTVSRNTHCQKSCSFKVKRAEFKSITFAGSISIISAISSDGWSFSSIQSTTINSENFVEFLKDLKKFIETKWKIQNRRVIIWLDNASSHSSKQTIKFLIQHFNAVFFLPQYSPQYAPVENFFSLFKSKLCSNLKEKSMSLKSDSAIKGINNRLKDIKWKEILGMWIHNIQILKDAHLKFIERLQKHYD